LMISRAAEEAIKLNPAKERKTATRKMAIFVLNRIFNLLSLFFISPIYTQERAKRFLFLDREGSNSPNFIPACKMEEDKHHLMSG